MSSNLKMQKVANTDPFLNSCKTKRKREATYIYAVVVGGFIPLEFVRRVVLISGQELTPKFATIRRCRQIEGETRNQVKAAKGAFA